MEPIAVVGHVAIDRIITRGGERHQLGGPPTYVSLITNLLGTQLRAATKVGGDFPGSYASELAARGLDIRGSIVPSAKTTRFVLDYTKSERGLGYDSLCAPIEPRDVVGLPEAAILAPIVGEIPGETLDAMESRVLALDPQGFVRRLEPGGSISLHPWRDVGLLRRLSVFKASARELRLVVGETGWVGLERLAGLGVVVAVETLGGEGARIVHSGRRMVVPAYVGETVDTTGAGDAFIAGFMAEYASGEGVEWCAAVGSAAASAVVETVGPRIKIGRGELFERAEKIRDRIEYLP
ncbi:MAG: PfkB family carbohydrate kinase [Candidatus Bathyarchaeota archaeon]|nr:PfkB family carbohydrate kinase [Candidatus Bathyarchaeota archaeon]